MNSVTTKDRSQSENISTVTENLLSPINPIFLGFWNHLKANFYGPSMVTLV